MNLWYSGHLESNQINEYQHQGWLAESTYKVHYINDEVPRKR